MILIGTPHTHNAGYYLNDDRNSGGRKAEADIQTCTHCQTVIKMQEWKVHGAWCNDCFAPICVICGAEMKQLGYCLPFIKRIEQYANRLIKLEQHLKIAGLEPEPAKPSLILPA